MDEIRTKKLEFDVLRLNHRLNDHDLVHEQVHERLDAVDKRVDVLTENTLAVVHLTETINSLVDALTFMSKIARALAIIAAACAATWAGIKYVWNHI